MNAMDCLHNGILWIFPSRWACQPSLDWGFTLTRPHFHNSMSVHPFRRGCAIKIFKSNSSTCPHHAMDHYRKVTGEITPSTPLYQTGRFHPLSRAAVTTTLRQLLKKAGIDHAHYSSHSFRIGAATTAAAAGLPACVIKSLGRWTSNTYLTYIHQQPALTSKIFKLLSNTGATDQPIWEPWLSSYVTYIWRINHVHW